MIEIGPPKSGHLVDTLLEKDREPRREIQNRTGKPKSSLQGFRQLSVSLLTKAMNIPRVESGVHLTQDRLQLMKKKLLAIFFVCTCSMGMINGTLAADWPMWRFDACRSAVSPQDLPEQLYLQWVREYPPLKPAWPDEPRMRFDVSYEPVVGKKTLFLASSRNDCVTALDTDTAEERWRFITDGPVRFAPVFWMDRVYLASDDGSLYCLNAADGNLIWKFRGAPNERRIIGNERLISTWPVRGAPVIAGGKIYFAAGIWPFMGVFVYALDAISGELLWVNDTSGSLYISQPHDSPAFSGIAPQGYLALAGETLLVPNGRAVAAGFNAGTGEFRFFQHAQNSQTSDSHVVVAGDYFINGGKILRLSHGKSLRTLNFEWQAAIGGIQSRTSDYDAIINAIHYPIATENTIYIGQSGSISAIDLQSRFKPLWSFETNAKVGIVAGQRLYASESGRIMAIDLPNDSNGPAISWETDIAGTPSSMIAADNKLFVSTLEGRIYCYGGDPVDPQFLPYAPQNTKQDDVWDTTAASILEETQITEGYCLLLGAGTGRLAEELLERSDLHIIGFDPDESKIDALRDRMIAAGLYGERIALHVGDILSSTLAPYMASLIVSEDLAAAGSTSGIPFLKRIFSVLRPYGGTACFLAPPRDSTLISAQTSGEDWVGAEVTVANGYWLLRRTGALPGSADWTHHYADSANTVVSKDELVKAPLGILWFGGPSSRQGLPIHGHGPSQQVVGGRIFIEGTDTIRAIDVYTGRVLWERPFDGIGNAYDHTTHEPGVNSVGSNYVSVHDGVYVIQGKVCHRLDPATGETLSGFELSSDGETYNWGHIKIWGDYLVAGLEPLNFDEDTPIGTQTSNATLSQYLAVLDRHTGEVLWTRKAVYGFYHNTIAVANGKLFCIDRMPLYMIGKMKRRGDEPAAPFTLMALQLDSGSTIWSTSEDTFGTWLGYSEDYDVLLQAGRPSTDSYRESGLRIAAYKGSDGTVLWDQSKVYKGPCLLHDKTIIAQHDAFDLLTGARKQRRNPITDQSIPWSFQRGYGCDTAVASKHLLTFRSAAAGFFDLENNSGTGNLGGFRSGCSTNLIVANGVLTAPEYTNSCSCSFQNQTSLAMIHMPENEMWTFNQFAIGEDPVMRLGVNLGAAGDRAADNGTLWLDYPTKNHGPSPGIGIQILPNTWKAFRRHTARSGDGTLPWVTNSGIDGVSSIEIVLAVGEPSPTPYDIRLYFSEPDYDTPGTRVFNVSIQGERVLSDFDIVKETSTTYQSLVREFQDISVDRTLTIAFEPSELTPDAKPVISGIEIVNPDTATPVEVWWVHPAPQLR